MRPHLRQHFIEEYNRRFPSEVPQTSSRFYSDRGKTNFDLSGMMDRKVYVKKTNFLKLEYESMISLSSKTYHSFGAYNKTSTKSLSKKCTQFR
jgi:hypothetical protein